MKKLSALILALLLLLGITCGASAATTRYSLVSVYICILGSPVNPMGSGPILYLR